MKKYIVIAMCAVTVVGASWYGFAREREKKEAGYTLLNDATLTNNTEPTAGDLDNADKKVIAELQQLFSPLASTSPLYLAGTINATNPADTIEASYITPFVFYKNISLLYYATEQQTLLNDSIAYTVADHLSRQLLVMPARVIAAAQTLPLPALSKLLKEDNYQITRTEDNGIISFQLLNENHINCKEMQIKADADTKAIISLYYRFTDFDHPQEKEWDKELSLLVHTWRTGRPALDVFEVPQLVQLNAGHLAPAKAYQDYELKNLIHP